MSLEYKFSERENLKDTQTFIVDNTQRSTKYFRVSDVPQVLQKGKNLLRITAHPTNLVDGTQIYVDVRDSNGEPIYFEIPDYLENDKSRVISIWIYNDKGIDNTPNGEATITLLGIANVDLNGNQLPSNQRGKINVKWQTTLNVDRDRNNSSEIIFNTNNVPNVIVSQSIEFYENQAQTEDILTKTIQTGKAKYIFSGATPIIQITDSSTLNSEMIGGDIILSEFTEPATPITNIEGPQSSTFFSSSIGSILNGNTLKPLTNFTTSFDNREDLTHTYESISEANYKIQYVQSGSNVLTQNKRNFVNLQFSNIDPITGVVDKIKILAKSQGLSGDFEFLNEVQIPYSSSADIKVPIPSKNLNDPKILKLLYLNAEGSISRTETISEPFVFDGEQVYIGGEDNLISGSIFISNTLGTGIEIGGASSGFIRSVGYRGITSASLGKAPGGFVIYSGSGNLVFGEDQLLGVGMEFVGDNDDRHLVFSTANGGILDVKTDKFFIGNLSDQYISGSDGNIEISSSIFHLDPKANGGEGALIIGANATILSDLTVENIRTPAQIDGAASTEANASSSIKADGFARFVSASIGGWGITTGSIEGGNLIMKPEGILQTRDFASGLKGWKISSEGNGTAEFENVRIRGTLRTTTFEKESVNAVGGQLWVANATTITGSVTAGETTMSVKNASGFSQGEILLAKKVDNTGFQTEYILLESASVDGDNSNEDETHGRIYVQRAYGSGEQGDFVGDLASAAQSYEDGQVIVSTGKLNTGYIKMNANPNDVNTPYMDIVERTGSGLYDVALKARLGDLSGLANSDYVFGNPTPGFGLATDNVFLQGGIIAKTGSIGGINMDDGKLFTGVGNYNNTNTGFYVDSGSQFSLGNKLSWNPSSSTLTIVGQLNFADGTSVQTAVNDITASIEGLESTSVARTVDLSADTYVITFDADGSEAPSGQTITLTATPQNFTGDVYYEFYKDASIQGSRSTTNTFSVDTGLEKPTATTPTSYEVRAFTGSSGGTSVSNDTLTLFGIQPGSDGAGGQDAVTTFLTNEAHTLPLSSSGVIQSYAGANTQMKVFEGITDKTSDYTFTESSPSHITATSSSNTFTITNTTSPYSGSVTITAVSESVSLSKIMSIGITRQGDDGSDGTPGVSGDNAKTLIGSVDSQIFAFDDSTDNSATPGTINFSFSQQNLNDVIVSSDITITTADGNGVTNFSFNNNSVGGDTNQKSGIVSGSVSYTGGFSSGGLNGAKTSLPLTISCTNDSLTDSVTVFKVEGGSDGAGGVDAVTAFLTNESHTLPSQNDGTVVSFAGAVTDMEVFEGTTNKNSVYAFSRTSSTSVSSSISDNTITITSMAHDSGSVIITAVSESVSLSKTMTLSKSKQGTAGLPGAAAKLLTLSLDSQVFAFPSASSSTPEDNDILIIVNQQNLSGTIGGGDITIKDSGGLTLIDPTFVADVTSGTGQVSGSLTFSGTVGGDKTKLPLTIEVAKDGLEDTIKIFKIDGGNEGQDGADAVTAFLTNESHTFAADATGAIAVFTGGTTDMEVFEGITNKTSAYTISRSSTTAVSSSLSGKTVTVTSMAHDSGSIIVNASSGSVSINKTMSLTKARQGVDGGDGTSAKLLIGSLDSQVMAFDDSSDSTATPTSIEFSFQQQNLSGSAGYLTLQSSDITIALNGGGNITNFDFNNSDVTNGTGIASGSISFTGNTDAGGMGGDKSKFPVTIAATKDGLNDTIKIFKVEGGADGTDSVQVILSNESHTLAAQPNGTVISFTGADTDVTVFEGITDKTSVYTISRTNGTGVSTNLIGDGSTYSAGASDVNVDVTGMTSDSGSVTINAASGSVSIDKIMSLTKAKQGQDGDRFVDTSITTTINLTTISEDETLTFTADTGLAWTAGLTAVLSYDSSNFINGTVNSYNSVNGAMSLNVDTITGAGSFTAWSLNVGGVAGPQGLSGANAKNIVASVDSQIFSFLSASDNVSDPTSIIFSFNQQNLNNATIGSGDITITGADTTSITGFIVNNNDVDGNFSGIVSGSLSFSAATDAGGLGSDKAKLPVTISATKDGLTDSIKIFKVEGGTAGSDGSDAVTAFLTNEAHTLAAANNGTVVSFNGAFTDMEVFEGVTNVTTEYTYSRVDGTGVTSALSGTDNNRLTISALGNDSGSVDITATSGSTTLTKTMSLVKSKQGAQGLAGDDAKMLTISSDSTVFSFPSASSSTAIDNTIELIINQQNLSATIDTNDLVIKDANNLTLSNPTLAPTSLTNNTGLVSGSITFSGTVNGDKTKLPLEITITQDGLTDTLKIFKVEGGGDGVNGTDAVNAFLSNESHTFPADSNGAIASFVGGSTDMEVFEGVTNSTSNYTISSSRGPGVVASDSGNTVTVSALGHDSGSLTITATSASVSLSKIMSLTKARQGSDGSDGTSAKLLIGSLNSQVFGFDAIGDTTSTPSSIEFSFQQQNLSGSGGFLTIGSSDIVVKDVNDSTITGFGFDNNDVVNGTGIVSGSITFASSDTAGGVGGNKSKLPITITATKDGLSDSLTIFKVEGGTDGVSGTSGYGFSTTYDKLDKTGNTNSAGRYALHTQYNASLGYTDDATDITTDFSTAVGFQLHKTDDNANDNSNYLSNVVQVGDTVTYYISDNRWYTYSIVTIDSSNQTNRHNFELSFISENISGGETAHPTLDDNPVEFRFSRAQDGTDGDNGTSAITALLTNDSHTLPVTSSIGVISYAGASTDIIVFQGTTDVTDDYTINTGSVSPHITTTTSGDTVTITNSTTPFSGSVVITATSASVSLSKTMSISQALQGDDGDDGAPGVNAKTITITSDTQTFAFDDSTDTDATPTSAVFSINQQNLSGAIAGTDITITKSDTNTIVTPTVSGATTNGTGTRTFTLPFSSLSKSDLPLSISVTKDGVTDTTSIIKIEGGANGVSALQYLLTNEAHIVPASYAGVVSDYSNSGTEIYVYEGTTELVYDAIGTSNGTWKINTPTISPSGKITAGSITDGGNYAVVAIHSGMDNNTDSVTISYPIVGKTADGTAFSFTKTQTITKSKEGAQGAAGTDSKTVSLTAGTNVVTYDADGLNPSPAVMSPITLTANTQNFTDAYFKFTGDFNDLQSGDSQYSDGTSANQDTFNWNTSGSYFSSPKTIRVGVSEAADSTTELAFDTVTIVAVKPGSQGIPGEPAFTQQFRYDDYDTNGGGAGASRYTFQNAYSAASSYASNTFVQSDFSTAQAVQFHRTDADGADNSTYYDTLVVGDSFVYYVSSDRWYQYTITTVDSSPPAGRYNFELSFVGENVEVAESQISTSAGTDVNFRFQRAIDGTDGAAGADAVTAFLTSEADVVPAAFNGTVSSFAGSGTTMKVFEGITDRTLALNADNTSAYTYTLQNTTTGLTVSLSTNVLTVSGLTPDSGSVDITATSASGTPAQVEISKTYSIAKSLAGPQGDTGADNQDFSFLDASLGAVTTPIGAGLLMTSNAFGYHNAITEGDGTNAQLSDFTSFLDSGGNFYLGGNAGGMSGSAATSGYFAWNNTDRSLLISGSNANIEVDKFLLGTGTSQYISGSNGNVEIAGDVTFRGRPDNGDGNVVFFDDFSQYFGTGAVDGGNFPKNDGTGDAWWFNKKPELVLVTDSDCISGQALQIGNNSGDDEANFFSNQLIPFNESSLYEIEVRIKRTAGNSQTLAYVGISGMQSDGTTRVDYSGGSGTGGHYVTLQGNNLGNDNGNGYFQIFKGYLKGTGTDNHLHNSKTDPANVRTEILNGYIRAYFLLNYNDEPGKTLVDYIKIKEFTSGGTSRISGDSITTGNIKSNNLSADSGSQFRLDDGTFKLGGTSSPKLEWDGNTLAVTGNITVSNPNDFADADADNTTSTFSAGFNKVVSPISQILAADGRPAGFFAAYSNNVPSTIQSSMGGDGIRRLMLYSATDNTIGMCTNAVEIQNGATYKIRLKFKGNGNGNGIYLRVYELDSFTGTTDTLNTVSFNDGTLKGISKFSTSTGEAGVVGNTREIQLTCTDVSDDTTYSMENGAISTSYVTVEATYTPTSTAKLFSVNVLNWSQYFYGQLIIEDLKVIPLGVTQGTSIGGDSIRTGVIKSLNLSPTEGSIINLDTGSMLMGGTDNPGFKVTKEGFVTATNIAESSIVVDSTNSSAYYEYYDESGGSTNDSTRLILDGSAGGVVTMNMSLSVAPTYIIRDIQFPSSAGSSEVMKLELTVVANGVEFDNVAVASGYANYVELLAYGESPS